MFEKLSTVEVFYEEMRVGILALAPDHRCLFEYDPVWINEGFSISPFYLPLKSGLFTAKAEPFDGLFGVFNDSLPDGWGRLPTDRWLMSKGYYPQDLTVLDRLSLTGDGGMGALIYSPGQNTKDEKPNREIAFYAKEAAKILHADYTGSLDELVIKAGSSGGTRLKILITIDGVDWLIKFKATMDPDDIGIIEYEHSLKAGKCGIEMPETRLFEGKYFGVKRFDRENAKRIHSHSAAGLLYASHRLPSLDYASLMKATMALTKDINEVAKLFRQMVFNVLIGNKDDHAKNFSYLYKNGTWQLSPAYDLLPSYGFNNNHTTTINGKGKPEIKDCMELARQTSFPEKSAKKIVDEVIEGLKS